MLPEQYTMPLYLTAWENCGRGLGAFSVKMPWIKDIIELFGFCLRFFSLVGEKWKAADGLRFARDSL